MIERKLTSLAVRAIKKIYPRFGLRESDIILASYPKSGNTWMRFIWANMISLSEFGGREIDFYSIDDEFAAVYDSHSYGSIEYRSLPRLVKTHREYDRRFDKNRSIYLYRNPGDTMLSYYDYKLNQRSSHLRGVTLPEFIRHPQYGVPAWCEHIDSWLDECDTAVSYECMRHDALEVVVSVLDKFGLSEVDKDIVKDAVERSTFEKMRTVEEESGRPSREEGRFREDFQFVNKGRYGEWKVRFTGRDIEYIENMLSKWGLLDEDLWKNV